MYRHGNFLQSGDGVDIGHGRSMDDGVAFYASVRAGRKPQEGRQAGGRQAMPGRSMEMELTEQSEAAAAAAAPRSVIVFAVIWVAMVARLLLPGSLSPSWLPPAFLRALCRNHYPKLSLRSFWTERQRGRGGVSLSHSNVERRKDTWWRGGDFSRATEEQLVRSLPLSSYYYNEAGPCGP